MSKISSIVKVIPEVEHIKKGFDKILNRERNPSLGLPQTGIYIVAQDLNSPALKPKSRRHSKKLTSYRSIDIKRLRDENKRASKNLNYIYNSEIMDIERFISLSKKHK